MVIFLVCSFFRWLTWICLVIVSATKGVETLKYRCVCRPHTEKFNIVSNDHGRRQKCKTPCIDRFSPSSLRIHSKKVFYRPSHSLYNTRFWDSVLVCKIHHCYCRLRKCHSFPFKHTLTSEHNVVRLDENKPFQNVLEVFSTAFTFPNCIDVDYYISEK